ncbi:MULTISPECIES: PTS sugar transporter subunit IIA [Hyphomicrobiales]|uniref:PTS sugar transporter subunit IIA n=1 Tax=Hyphomicrobiales TaxID=356 RepID=UPI001F446AB1|nr:MULTISPECIES: PTS sugar transporter subunit IIA [Hyphomicrobiales]
MWKKTFLLSPNLGVNPSDQLPSCRHRAIQFSLLGRESLGSTGIGHGDAMPHAPVLGIQTSFAALMVLKKPIDF